MRVELAVSLFKSCFRLEPPPAQLRQSILLFITTNIETIEERTSVLAIERHKLRHCSLS